MPSSTAKIWLKKGYHGFFHPGTQIGDDAYVDRRASVDPSVTIGANTKIFPSKIHAGCVIGDDCLIGHESQVSHSRLESDVHLESAVEVHGSKLDRHIRIQTQCSLTDVQLGRHSYIARETRLNDVTIGAFASIGPRCLLGTGEHPVNLVSTSPVFYSTRGQCGPAFADETTFDERKKIIIGHDVWLGAHVFVRDGIVIGDGAIVAAGSVVTANVAPYAIVGGVPAKLIRPRFSAEAIARLLKLQWWHWSEVRLRAGQPLMASPDLASFLDWAEQPFSNE
jgi:acetyltransferase-like isoleucine patch superfamily enzyme